MKSNTSLLATLPSHYKEQIKKLSTEGLETIFHDREKALEYAKKGVEQMEPENRNEDYIIKVAESMQILARIVLEERGVLAKS